MTLPPDSVPAAAAGSRPVGLGWLVLFAGILIAGSGAARAQSSAPSAERGKTLFVQHMCYTCHGYAGQGGERGSGPRLVPNLFPYPAFVQQVRHPRQDMPRYSPRFTSDADLADMHAYLASTKPGPKAADIPALRD